MLPGIDGYDVYKKIRKNDRVNNLFKNIDLKNNLTNTFVD
jgi:CheY-like chemotaxis protein